MTEDRPERIQLRRTRGWKMPPNTVKVDRTSVWGNPYKLADVDGDPARAVSAFRSWLMTDPRRLAAVAALAGNNLACWCALDAPCHADVLLELANADAVDGTPDAELCPGRTTY